MWYRNSIDHNLEGSYIDHCCCMLLPIHHMVFLWYNMWTDHRSWIHHIPVLDQYVMDPTTMIYTHVAPKKNHAMNGKEHVTAMMSVPALWSVVNGIVKSLQVQQTIVETKSLTVAIQVCIYFDIKRCNPCLIIASLLFWLASRSLSCNSLNNGPNGCEELDSICMVKKIGKFLFFVSSKKKIS